MLEVGVNVSHGNEGLRKLRTAAGLSQNQLAQAAGINRRVLQNYEQGIRDLSGAKLSTLLKICIAIRCKLRDIVTDEQTRKLLDEYNGIR